MDATMDATATMLRTERRGPGFNRARPSWTAVAAMLLSVTMPICGWMVSLSNRVAVLEEKTASLATAAQMAEVKQKIDDWIELSNRLRLDDQARAAREGK
jgi:hypothetical protein